MWVASRGGRERRDKKGFEAEGIRKEFKKSQKTFQKGIDKPSRVWYNSQAVRESGWHGH